MYNAQEIRPFLTRHNPHAPRNAFFHGTPVDVREAAAVQGNYLFHATRLKNLIGIMTDGLLAARGGIAGAGAILAGGIFAEGDRGWLFASAFPQVVDCYAHEYDTHADAGAWENAPILLRFERRDTDGFIPDTQHDGAVKTQNDISPDRLEILTPDGWVVCTGDVRNEIVNTLLDMGLGA